MAASRLNKCYSCLNKCNITPVQLSCGHGVCKPCHTRQRASGKYECTSCSSSSANMDPPLTPSQLPSKRARRDQEDFEKKISDHLCQKHSKKYEFWVNDIKTFYCSNCAAENPPVKLELIEESVPQIREVFAAKVAEVKKKVEHSLETQDAKHAKRLRKRKRVEEIVKAVQALDDDTKQDIEHSEDSRSEVADSLAGIEELEKKINNIKHPADLSVVVEGKSILERAVASSSVPAAGYPHTLFCSMTCACMEEAGTGNPPSSAPSVHSLLKSSSVGSVTEVAKPSKASSRKPSPTPAGSSSVRFRLPNTMGPASAPTTYCEKASSKTAAATKPLEAGQEWTVNDINSEAALRAMTDRMPSVLNLVASDVARKTLPVAELAITAKDCKVTATFVDTFYTGTNTATDARRLKYLTFNQSLYLDEFYGHLDQSAITKLPRTISVIGLTIDSAADAVAVSGLRPWNRLMWIHVSITHRVAAKDLKPLPWVQDKRLIFPYLASICVDDVKPAITALVPDLRVQHLFFPKSELTVADARRLIRGLHGMKIARVTIEPGETMRLRQEDKESLEAELRDAVKCRVVEWNMNWIYR